MANQLPYIRSERKYLDSQHEDIETQDLDPKSIFGQIVEAHDNPRQAQLNLAYSAVLYKCTQLFHNGGTATQALNLIATLPADMQRPAYDELMDYIKTI